MDKINEMRIFTEAAQRGGFSAAAEVLNLSPSAVSKLITRLEQRLGVRLFNRSTRSLNLTEAGQSFLVSCESILADIEQAEQALSDYGHEPKGLLRINSSSGFAKHQIIPLLPEFQRRYPQLEIDLQLTGQAVNLIEERVDVAIRLGNLKGSSLIARKLMESPRIICASPDYLARFGSPVTPEDLRAHNCLRLSTSESFNCWRFTSSLNKPPAGRKSISTDKGQRDQNDYQIEISGGFITDNVDSLHELAVQGGGIARLAEFMVQDDIKTGRLVPLLEQYNQEKQPVHALYPHRRHLPLKTKVFIEFLQASL